MAWAEKRPDGRWRGIYRDPTGRKRSKSGFARKNLAVNWASEQETSRADPDGPRTRWSDWCDQWWAARRTEVSTEKSAQSKLDRHVRPAWDEVKLGEITRLDVQTWVNRLARKLGASTVRQCYYLLSNSLKLAVVHGLLDGNPSLGVTLPDLPTAQERYLSTTEVDQVFYHLDTRWRILCELLVGTGLRIGEAAGLHADRLHLHASPPRIDVVDVWVPKARRMRAYPKGKKRRSVPIPAHLAARLTAWLDQHPPGRSCGEKHDGGVCRSGLVVTNTRGRPVDPNHFNHRQWATAVDLSEIGHARPHDLRHTWASRLVQAGVSLERVRDLAGHSSVTTTERYGHLQPDAWDDVLAALEDQGAEKGAPSPTTPSDGNGRRNGLRAVSPASTTTPSDRAG